MKLSFGGTQRGFRTGGCSEREISVYLTRGREIAGSDEFCNDYNWWQIWHGMTWLSQSLKLI
jgi:hypothetical protein